MSLHPCFHRRWLLQVASEIGKSRHRTSVFFSVVAEATQVAPKASPRKNFKWMLIERWRRPSMLSSMRQHVATLQFDSCAEKQPFWNSHDGLNLACLDQCHCVGSPKKHLCGHRHWSRRLPPEQQSGLYPQTGRHLLFGPPFFWGAVLSHGLHRQIIAAGERFVPTPHAPCCQ